MRFVLLVGTGSFIGGVLRYGISHFIHLRWSNGFPWGTMTVNIIGSFLIGIVFGLFDKQQLSPEWNLFLAVGILGGFTTFSAFSNETLNFLKSEQYQLAALYVMGSVGLGLMATFGGMGLVK